MSAFKPRYPSEKDQIMRQLQAGPNNSIPDTTLQQIHQHEATAVGSEKLFNSFTTQVADIKKDMDYLHSRLNTIEGDTRASHEKSRNFIHQASKLLLDYASDKGIEVMFGKVSFADKDVNQQLEELTEYMEKLTVKTDQLNGYSEEIEERLRAADTAKARAGAVLTSADKAFPNQNENATFSHPARKIATASALGKENSKVSAKEFAPFASLDVKEDSNGTATKIVPATTITGKETSNGTASASKLVSTTPAASTVKKAAKPQNGLAASRWAPKDDDKPSDDEYDDFDYPSPFKKSEARRPTSTATTSKSPSKQVVTTPGPTPQRAPNSEVRVPGAVVSNLAPLPTIYTKEQLAAAIDFQSGATRGGNKSRGGTPSRGRAPAAAHLVNQVAPIRGRNPAAAPFTTYPATPMAPQQPNPLRQAMARASATNTRSENPMGDPTPTSSAAKGTSTAAKPVRGRGLEDSIWAAPRANSPRMNPAVEPYPNMWK
ncbi:hypothetical protein MBLNU230_g4564t1 [Neophaeotheca triangularis]